MLDDRGDLELLILMTCSPNTVSRNWGRVQAVCFRMIMSKFRTMDRCMEMPIRK